MLISNYTVEGGGKKPLPIALSGNSGAGSYAFVKALICDGNPLYIDLLNSMRKLLKFEYSQIIQLSTNKKMDMSAPFII